jgi:hypothetical protein
VVRAAETALEYTYETARIPTENREEGQVVHEEQKKKAAAQLEAKQVLKKNDGCRSEEALAKRIGEHSPGICRIEILVDALQ